MAIDPIIGSAKVEVYGDFSPLDKDTERALSKFDKALSKRLDESLKPLKEKTEKVGTEAGDNLTAGIQKSLDKNDITKDVDVHANMSPMDREVERGMVGFDRTLRGAIERIDLIPSWRRVLSRLGDDRGSADIGEVLGKNVGKKANEGIAKGVKSGSLQATMTRVIGSAFVKFTAMGTLAAFGARAAVALGGGLLGELATVGTAITGWVSTVVGGAGQALAGIGAVAGGTFATAFAGAYGTVLTSIAAVLPAVKGLQLAFAGLEDEEKKALEKRLKAATENLKGFGRAVRAELLPAVFDALKTIDKLVPTLNKFGTELGKTAAGLVRDFAKMATAPAMVKEIDTFLSASTGYFEQLGDAAINLVGKILPAFNAISPVTRKFFDYVAKGADAAAKALERLSLGGENSVLTTTLDKWFTRTTKLIGVFGTFGKSIAKVFNIAADVGDGKGFIESLQKMADAFSDFIDRVSNDRGQDGLSATLGDWYDKGKALAGAFGNLSKIILLFFDSAAKAGGDFMQDFKRTTDEWLAQFERFRDSGDLQEVLTKWWEQGKTLLNILGDVGKALLNVLGAAADANDDFLTTFEKTTEKWRDWTDSVTGQNTLKQYFEEARPVVEETWGLLGDIIGLFAGSFTGDTGNLVGFIQTIRRDWIPAIEDMQEIIRGSGIQDSLYKLAEAFGRLFEIGGGALNGMLSTLAVAINGLATALELLGPVVPVLAAFVGSMKALSLLKFAFMGVGLGQVATGLSKVGVALGLKTAAGVEATAASTGKLAALGTKLNLAFAAVFAISTAVSLFKPPPVAETEKYSKALQGLGETSKSVKDLLEAPWADGALLDKMGLYGSTIEDLQVRLGGLEGFAGGAAKFFTGISDFLGLGVTDAAVTKLDSITGAIEGLAQSGNWKLASEQINQFKDIMVEKNIDPKYWEDTVARIRESIANLTTEEFSAEINRFLDIGNIEKARDTLEALAAALSAQGYDPTVITQALQGLNDQIDAMAETNTVNFSGLFTPEAKKKLDEDIAALYKMPEYVKDGGQKLNAAGQEYRRQLLESFGKIDLGENIQNQLKALRDIPGMIDAETGLLSEKGMQAKIEILAEADFGSVNDALYALTETDRQAVIEILGDDKSWNDKTNELTNKAYEAVMDLIVTGIPEGEAELARLEAQASSGLNIPVAIDFTSLSNQGGSSSEYAKWLAEKKAQFEPIPVPAKISIPDDNYVMLRDAVETKTKDDPFDVFGAMNPAVDLTEATAGVRATTLPLEQRIAAHGKLDPKTFSMSEAKAYVRANPFIVNWKLADEPIGGTPTTTTKPSTTGKTPKGAVSQSSADSGTSKTVNLVLNNNYQGTPRTTTDNQAAELRASKALVEAIWA